MAESILILAIESSCDDTGIAVLKDGKILSNVINQQKIHEEYGGVVPEKASRLHLKYIVPTFQKALEEARVQKEEISAVAFTQSPGLIGSLLVGEMFAKGLSLSLNIPLIAVQHLRAHVLSLLIEDPRPAFPFLCLTVSGGHTQIILCRSVSDMVILGETIDDAAGEAFDKTSKMLGLPYPGGPVMDKLAQTGNPKAFSFAQPVTDAFNFSFSGLKTSVLYFLQKQSPSFISDHLNDLCASVQYAIVESLIRKLMKAQEEYQIKEVGIAGGVSANSYLRKRFLEECAKRNCNAYYPKMEYCTDNAAMIATAAYYKFLANDFADLSIHSKARVD